ncbi:MAG: hypothetical protein U1F60_06670 [Planctomycetota bacterium]
MHTPSRTPQWGDTVLILLFAAAFVLMLGSLAYFLVFEGLGSNGEPVQPSASEPLLPACFLPALCTLGAAVSMTIAIRIVVRHRE